MWYWHRGNKTNIKLASGNAICSRIMGCRSRCTTWMGPIRFAATGSHHKGFAPGVRGGRYFRQISGFFQQLVVTQSGNKEWNRGHHHFTMDERFTANQIDKMWPAMIYLLIPTVQRWIRWVILVRSMRPDIFWVVNKKAVWPIAKRIPSFAKQVDKLNLRKVSTTPLSVLGLLKKKKTTSQICRTIQSVLMPTSVEFSLKWSSAIFREILLGINQPS